MKNLLFLFFLLTISILTAQQTASYGWEDGIGTALGTYGNAVLENSDEQTHTGSYALKYSEDPLDGTPQAYVWWITGLTDGDVIDASFWVYDSNAQGDYPKGRIWGHYTEIGGTVNDYAGSAGGNDIYSTEGWSLLEWSWTFDSDGDTQDGFVVEARIYSSDPPDNIIYVDDAEVTVSSNTATIHSPAPPTEPTIIVTSPNGGEEWEQGSTHDITWTSVNFTDNVKIEAELIDGSREILIGSTENDGVWAWNISETQPLDDWYVIIVSDAADSDPWDQSDEPFSIIAPAQESITVTYPNGNQNWYQGNSYAIEWTSQNYNGDIQIDLFFDDTYQQTLVANTENDGFWQWDIPEDQQIGDLYKVSIFDPVDGIPQDESDSYFFIVEAVQPPDEGDIIINEIMQNPSAVTDAEGEWFELYNTGSTAIDLHYWVIKDADTDEHIITEYVVIQPTDYIVMGVNIDPATNGGLTVDYVYDNITLANGSDELMLCWTDGTTVVDMVIYDNGETFPDPNGASMELDPASMNYLDNDDGANWNEAVVAFGDGDLGTPGVANSETALPGSPSEPFPLDEAVEVPLDTELSWINGLYTMSIDLYLDTVDPPEELVLDNVEAVENYLPDILELDTTYFWQVVGRNNYGETAGEIWQFTTTTTDADEELIQTPQLLGNYPNPFNPFTTIKFNLCYELSADTELLIYNLKGQLVKKFCSSDFHYSSIGEYLVTWNGKNENSVSVPSGVYFYKLVTGKVELTKKMALIK